MFTSLNAAETATTATQGGSFLGSLLPLIFLFAIFYFIVIRPQQKQAKEHKVMLTELQKGDKIVTAGGFIVEIVKVEENFYKVSMADNTIVKLTKESVSKRYEEA